MGRVREKATPISVCQNNLSMILVPRNNDRGVFVVIRSMMTMMMNQILNSRYPIFQIRRQIQYQVAYHSGVI
jgi:hypothetical protein